MHDTQIHDLIAAEVQRQSQGLEMIPSENHTSPAVLAALGSRLTDKYSEGYPGRRYYGGCEVVDQVENLARDRAKSLFGVTHANVQSYSGSPANLAVFFALLNPGDTVMGLELYFGGHLSHGLGVNFSGVRSTAFKGLLGRPLHKIKAPRGPRNVLCVVVVMTSAIPAGDGCSPATTSPAMCEISANKNAPHASATSRSFCQSKIRGYAVAPTIKSLGLCFLAMSAIAL